MSEFISQTLDAKGAFASLIQTLNALRAERDELRELCKRLAAQRDEWRTLARDAINICDESQQIADDAIKSPRSRA